MVAVALPLLDDADRPRPRTRGDCEPGGPMHVRPCPWTRCRYSLHEVRGAAPVCVLDVAAEGGRTLGEVGELLGVCRERIRQIEAKALRKMRRVAEGRGLSFGALVPGDAPGDAGGDVDDE